MSSMDPQKLVVLAFLTLSTLALGGASCDKKSAATPVEAREMVTAVDKAGAKAPPVNQDPIPGVDVAKLDEQKRERFYRLIDMSLQSPCGKPHSLRTSLTEDAGCKRAPFAARYAIALLADEASDDEVKQYYDDRYRRGGEVRTFTLGNEVPRTGPPDAPVKLVEFYDYGCPSCKHFAPILKEAVSDFPSEAVLYYKQFPLPSHPDSGPAAQAALAAGEQGKFEQMHELLFLRAPRHKASDLMEYAKALELDMKKFEADFVAVAPRVMADITEGHNAGIRGTPSLFINGREYSGPLHPDYLKMWIQEELAVNR